jgi:hypothetical protein
MSKSASEMSTPFGFLAATLPAASVTLIRTGLHSATLRGLAVDVTTSFHGPVSCAWMTPALTTTSSAQHHWDLDIIMGLSVVSARRIPRVSRSLE